MMSTIGYRLSQFITSKWGTIKSISEEINTAPNLISTYVNNRSVPGGVFLSKLAEYGLNINWLLTGKGNMLLESIRETTIDFLLRPSEALLENMDVEEITDYIYGGNVSPVSKLDLPSLLQDSCLLGYVWGNSMIEYGVQMNDTLVIRKLETNEVLEDSLVIIHTFEYQSNQFILRYYDKKTNQLLSGSKDLLPIPYDPRLIVPARISSVIRNL